MEVNNIVVTRIIMGIIWDRLWLMGFNYTMVR